MVNELVILLILGLIVFAFVKMGRQSKKNSRDQRASRHRNVRAKLQPFDAESARLQPRKTGLEGPAYVIDGDTVLIRKTQIRLFGIDAPEINHPFGKKAKWALFFLCKGHTVRAEIIEQDDYGRTVARCYLQDGRDLSAEMVKLGLAIDWPKFSDGEYRAMEVLGARKKLWLADARQKGRMHVWRQFEARRQNGTNKD